MHTKRPALIQDVFATLELTKRAMFTRFYHSAVAEAGISPSNLRMLFVVEHAQPVQPKDLAGKMYLTPGAVTQSIDALVREGYLTRTHDENDRRGTFINLTTKGQEKVATLKKAQQERFTQMVSELSDHELKVFLRAQQKMLHFLEHEDKETK